MRTSGPIALAIQGGNESLDIPWIVLRGAKGIEAFSRMQPGRSDEDWRTRVGYIVIADAENLSELSNKCRFFVVSLSSPKCSGRRSDEGTNQER